MAAWLASKGFPKDFRRVSPPLQTMAVAEVQRVQLMDATLPSWTAHFDRVEGMRERSVIELELGGGPRMLVNVADGQATLLAMGDHEITRRYAMRRRVVADLAGAVPLPAEFSPLRGPSLFPTVSSGRSGSSQSGQRAERRLGLFPERGAGLRM